MLPGAPPVLEFDHGGQSGAVTGADRAQGYEWPESNHGIFVDYKGNVWIGGNGANDAHILKFTKDGKFLLQIGRARGNEQAGSNDTENFGRVAKIFVDPQDQRGLRRRRLLNKRVAVLDADTGKLKRYWGAYGNKPDDANLGPYDPDGAARAAVPQSRCTAPTLERRLRLRLRPRRTIGSRCSRPTASS